MPRFEPASPTLAWVLLAAVVALGLNARDLPSHAAADTNGEPQRSGLIFDLPPDLPPEGFDHEDRGRF